MCVAVASLPYMTTQRRHSSRRAGKNHSRIIEAAPSLDWTGLNDYVDAMNETHGQRRAEQLVCADCDHSEVMLILSQPLYLPPLPLSVFPPGHGLSLRLSYFF